MIVLIPLGGIGKRFKDLGYTFPKPLIEVMGKPILYWLLDNLNYNSIEYIVIPYNQELVKYNFENKLISDYPNLNFKFLKLQNNTRGASDTIKIALDDLQNQSVKDCPVLCLDGDNFYFDDIITKWDGNNVVFTFIDEGDLPIFSYISVHDTDLHKIIEIREKIKISNKASTGAYGFNSWKQLLIYCKLIIEKKIMSKGEFYTSNVINEMIKNDIYFTYNNIENNMYHSLGTPEQVTKFENYAFLFDLDGTLVHTDNVYLKVWDEILSKYNISVDEKFFDNFIKGKSDDNFLKYLLPDITSTQIDAISNQKDAKFIKYLKQQTKDSILIDGVVDFFEKIKNNNIAIVTNCNRKSAEFILKHTNLDKYVNLLISSNDCINKKPDPEPYQKAIDYFNIDRKRCIVFEDSGTGYLSAKGVNVFKIIIVINDKSCQYIRNLNEIKINDFLDLDMNIIFNGNKLLKKSKYIKMIKNKLDYLPIKNIVYNDVDIKAGYICDINSYKLIYNNKNQEEIILKISNLDNELSKTATKLNMYSNESYFYQHISKLMNMIHIPRSYGIIIDGEKQGILMESLNKYTGTFNLNLNKNINMLLVVISEIFKVHSIFYFRDETEIIKDMKTLLTFNKINYYQELINDRFDIFINKNKLFLSQKEEYIMRNIYNNFSKISNCLSSYPLSFCHGDLKSPNIFYKNYKTPYFLDWQYIHLNKGVSDIVFMCVESIKFNQNILDIVNKYYYQLILENIEDYTFQDYITDFKCSLCAFPFFVCVWFNSEDSDKLLDKCFPIRFMKNLLKYYNYYLDDKFFVYLSNQDS